MINYITLHTTTATSIGAPHNMLVGKQKKTAPACLGQTVLILISLAATHDSVVVPSKIPVKRVKILYAWVRGQIPGGTPVKT